MGVVLNGKQIAAQLKAQLEQERARLRGIPQLRVLYFDTPASQKYWLAQREAAVALQIGTDSAAGGVVSEWKSGSTMQPLSVTQETVERIIHDWNNDSRVHGIFVHQPLPNQLDAQRISALIDPRKDIEGIHPQNSVRRFFAKARIGSCTALAVMELIDEALRQGGESLEGKEAVVVGHSEIVGRPVSMLLLDRLATTTVCHVGTDRAGRLEEHVRRADVLVVAAGQPRLIKGAWIKPGSIVIDVGINVDRGRVVGDVEFEAAKEQAAFISPVPGGVGPVTVMIVMKNTLEAFKLQQSNG
ncbi:MAG: bifunctional 5,10-methylenetetrahydrofolate dehydrogenase/5,10-methenyltetrahydrofolate cyclohydrolase [Candidatus Omnitrophica bacterium]|nr:bifunctional 5,10-methylenetetrahydrofolate dehydrogenase/5,10-methenyltetrahydrofolate cyclohydrolase [Candidatus Omnitrophota bacterium]